MMKLQVTVGFLALCLAVSCRPIGPPDGHQRPSRRPVPTTAPVVPIPAETAAPAVSPPVQEIPPAAASSPTTPAQNASPARPSTSNRPALPPASKPATPKDPYLTAQKVPNKPGYALSPHTGKLVLIDGIPSGVVVPDQTCPPGEKKFFRVP